MTSPDALSPWVRILKGHLGVKPGERVMILTDRVEDYDGPKAEIVVAPSTGGHGREPREEVWQEVFGAAAVSALEMNGVMDRLLAKRLDDGDLDALERWAASAAPLAPDVILALTRFSTSHTLFRRFLTRGGTRYASMPRFDRDLLRPGGPLDIEPGLLILQTRTLRDRLANARTIRVRTPRGTDLEFEVEGRPFYADDGELRGPGAFGNLPAGEVYVAPVEGKTRGTLVLEDETRITIEEGRATRLAGNGALARLFAEHADYFAVAELGFGTNQRASRTDHVLEAEKIAGTIHVAFGDNATFGGTLRLPYHEDHVLFSPTVLVDGRPFEGYGA